jgi:hypothetical protein
LPRRFVCNAEFSSPPAPPPPHFVWSPSPAIAGADKRLRSRDAFASARCDAWRWLRLNRGIFHFCFPLKEGSGAPNGAVDCHLLPGTARRELHPLPGTAAVLMTRAAHLSVLHVGLMEVTFQPGLGQRFLESPDANGRAFCPRLPLRHQCSEHLAVRTHAGRADAQAACERR